VLGAAALVSVIDYAYDHEHENSHDETALVGSSGGCQAAGEAKMRPKQLHHASIRVADLERSRAFYSGLLRLREIDRPDLGFRGSWYGIGAGQLHLIQREPLPVKIDPTGPHFAIEVEDLNEARRELQADGVEILDPGGDQLWVLDPDGYTVEITQVRESRAKT
jgi:glyoxylase I family protein